MKRIEEKNRYERKKTPVNLRSFKFMIFFRLKIDALFQFFKRNRRFFAVQLPHLIKRDRPVQGPEDKRQRH